MNLFEKGAGDLLFKLPVEFIDNMQQYTPMQYQVLCSLFAALPQNVWMTEPITSGLITHLTGLRKESILRTLKSYDPIPFTTSLVKNRTTNGLRTRTVYIFNEPKIYDILPQNLLKLDGELIKLYILTCKRDKMGSSKRYICEMASISHHSLSEYLSALETAFTNSSWFSDQLKKLYEEWNYSEEDEEVPKEEISEVYVQASKLEKILPQLWKAASLPDIYSFTDWYKIAYQMTKKKVELGDLGIIFKKLRDMKTPPKSPSYLIEMRGNKMVFEMLNEKKQEKQEKQESPKPRVYEPTEDTGISMGLSDAEYIKRVRAKEAKEGK